MKNTSKIGQIAEGVVARELRKRGFRVIGQNIKTPQYEIDVLVVDPLSNRHHFIEVKYRYKTSSGSALNTITDSKLRQMQKAADLYMIGSKQTAEYVLGAASVMGADFQIEELIEIIE